ncbi:MAG TPA: formyltransferase family protein, partial [Polyangiaceae bacterium]
GLPLGAWALLREGHALGVVVLSPVPAPGRRRLARLLDSAALLDFLQGAEEQAVDLALRMYGPDLLLSWFWTRRLPEAWLGCTRFGGYNVHPSLLPRHRGPNPYFAAIDAGDSITGVTLHRLDAHYDTGPVVATASLPVGERNAWQLARALDRPSLRLLRDAARWASEGRLPPAQAQSEQEATWAGEPEGDQLRLDWRWSTERILRRIRALAPVPGLALAIHGIDFFVTQARATSVPALALEPGEAAVTDGGVVIRTADGAIAIERAVHADTEADWDGATLASLLAEHAPRAPGPKT